MRWLPTLLAPRSAGLESAIWASAKTDVALEDHFSAGSAARLFPRSSWRQAGPRTAGGSARACVDVALIDRVGVGRGDGRCELYAHGAGEILIGRLPRVFVGNRVHAIAEAADRLFSGEVERACDVVDIDATEDRVMLSPAMRCSSFPESACARSPKRS